LPRIWVSMVTTRALKPASRAWGHRAGRPRDDPEVVQLDQRGPAAAAVTSAHRGPDMELNVKMVPAAPAAPPRPRHRSGASSA